MNDFEIKNTQKYGVGVFATRNIKKGSLIYKLSGEVITEDECWRRINEKIENLSDPLQIGEHLYIDLDETSRSFNHSCDPNSGIRNESDLYAIKDINIGDEILYDYSTTVGPNVPIDEWSMDCSCKSLICRKKISNILTISKDQLNFYFLNNVIPDFQKKFLVM